MNAAGRSKLLHQAEIRFCQGPLRNKEREVAWQLCLACRWNELFSLQFGGLPCLWGVVLPTTASAGGHQLFPLSTQHEHVFIIGVIRNAAELVRGVVRVSSSVPEVIAVSCAFVSNSGDINHSSVDVP